MKLRNSAIIIKKRSIKIEKKINLYTNIIEYFNDLNMTFENQNGIKKNIYSIKFSDDIQSRFSAYIQALVTMSWIRFPSKKNQSKSSKFYTTFKNEKNQLILILKYLILKHLTIKYIQNTKELNQLYFKLFNLKTRKPGQEIVEIVESMIKVIMKQQEHIEKMRKKKFTTLNISVKRNNIFASVTNEETKKVKYAVPLQSANQLGLKISKVNTRFYLEEVIEKYFKFINRHFKRIILEYAQKNQQGKKKDIKSKQSVTFKNKLALNLICPPKYRKRITRLFFKYVSKRLSQKRNILIDVRASKIFNGCRGKKLLRKKRLKLKYLNKHFM